MQHLLNRIQQPGHRIARHAGEPLLTFWSTSAILLSGIAYEVTLLWPPRARVCGLLFYLGSKQLYFVPSSPFSSVHTDSMSFPASTSVTYAR